MNAFALELPGIEQIRLRFLDLLESRKSTIAQHALAAWDGETAEGINDDLQTARNLLHQIAGTAGTVGYADLGMSAHECEGRIIDHLEGKYADLAICPGEIMLCIDTFLGQCDAISR
ncbi:MAG: Hpt domain-containing protein [Sulfitobacter sp.]